MKYSSSIITCLQSCSYYQGISVRPGTVFSSKGKILCAIGDKGSKWDKQWSDLRRKAKQGLPKTDSQPVQSAPRYAKYQGRGGKIVREQESELLNVWTQEGTFKILGGLVVALLFLFLFVIGPP